MGLLNHIAAAAALASWLLAPAASPAAAELAAESAYELSQAAIGRKVGDHVLRDQASQPLPLAQFRGKPLVVSLIFTSCSTVCPITTDYLLEQVRDVRKTLGDDSFAVLTFGFDASGDRPAQLAAFANTHRLNGVPEWYIASADEATTEALLADLGFSFEAAAGGFDHITQTSILDAEGKVYRQLYGETYPLQLLMEPLKDLVLGLTTRSIAPSDLWDRLTFICTVYNPATGAYRFDYSIFFGIFFGALSLILTALVIVRLWLGNKRYNRTAGADQAS